MKKFSALLFVTVLIAVTIFASSAIAADDTFVYADKDGKVGFLKVSDDTIAKLDADTTGITKANLGNSVKVFPLEGNKAAIATGEGKFAYVKASEDVVALSGDAADKC